MAGTNNYYGYSTNPYQPTVVGNFGGMPSGMQTAVPLPQQSQSQSSILTIFVNSEEEVNFYPVAAGLTVMLVSFNLGKFWLKSTGKNGVPEPLRSFTFEEHSMIPENQNGSNFATKDEVSAISMKLDRLLESLGGDK